MGVFIRGWQRRGVTHWTSVVVTPPAIEPLTIAQGQKYARDADYDPELMANYIRAAREKVEQDTGLALLTQTRDHYADYVSGLWIDLPAQSRPLQSVTSIKTTDTSGVINTMDVDDYTVDLGSGRIGLADLGYWPTDLRRFQPWVIRVVSGWTSPSLVPPLLVHAVGLLVGHFANVGRDAVIAGAGIATAEMPLGYRDAIAPHQLVTVA